MTSSSRGRVAGIDYGTVRIGVAISDPGRTLSSPLANFTRRDRAAEARYFQKLVADERVELFVVGLPVHLDGSESAKSVESRRFGQWLGEATGVPVEYFDERFTSVEAEGFLLSAGLTNKRRKARRDMVAAQILLSAYLESQSSQGSQGGQGRGASAGQSPQALDDDPK